MLEVAVGQSERDAETKAQHYMFGSKDKTTIVIVVNVEKGARTNTTETCDPTLETDGTIISKDSQLSYTKQLGPTDRVTVSVWKSKRVPDPDTPDKCKQICDPVVSRLTIYPAPPSLEQTFTYCWSDAAPVAWAGLVGTFGILIDAPEPECEIELSAMTHLVFEATNQGSSSSKNPMFRPKPPLETPTKQDNILVQIRTQVQALLILTMIVKWAQIMKVPVVPLPLADLALPSNPSVQTENSRESKSRRREKEDFLPRSPKASKGCVRAARIPGNVI